MPVPRGVEPRSSPRGAYFRCGPDPQNETPRPVHRIAFANSRSKSVGHALLAAIRQEIDASLTPRQREVLVALALNEVPIDVLAERMDTSRGALYKVLHDARQSLRAALARRGLDPEQQQVEESHE